ncbi:MAG TPA: ribonuclease J [Actinomycetota bacterium]|nr:ribonuclease J [Actinomycetota bacterium]
MADPCRLVFLGGLGEVGRNMAVLEMGGRALILDAGLSFPGDDMPGIDLVLPDWEYLRGRGDTVDGVILTHGHEDHVGALPYLLREMELDVYATALTLALLGPKLEEHEVANRIRTHPIEAGGSADIGPFRARFHRVTHSIPDGVAVAVDTPFGTILHTGDFRLDPTPIDDRLTDLQGIGDEGHRGVHVLLSDSTGAERTGTVPSERTVGPVIREIVEDAPRLVVAACFASHIHRIQQICDAAVASGRKVAFLGRSMLNAVEQAGALGHLRVGEDDVVEIERLGDLDPRTVCVVSTGSQGEPLSALALMAAREHKYVTLEDEDTVILSASVIPGNEVAINRVIDGLYRTGASVYHVGTVPVHVSGHAAADELKLMLNLVRPRWFIPIHGERRHLANHARLAREVGIAEDHVLVCEDGDVVEIGDSVRPADRVQAGMTLVDGLGIGDVGHEVLRDRRKLAGDGVVIVVVIADAHTGEILAGPDIVTRGFVHDETSEEILEEARRRTLTSLKEVEAEEGGGDPSILKQHIRRILGRYFFEVIQRKPIIVPVIMEV